MAKFEPWLKMWVEWTDDPKMLSLTLAEQGAWWRLVTLAKKCAADGFLVKGDRALSLDQIADAIRIRTKADRGVFMAMVTKMTDLSSLHWNSDTLVITHFAKRQAKIASETPEAVRDRVRRHRERKATTENPLQQPSLSSPPDPPITKDEEKDREEKRGECNVVTSLHGNEKSVTSEPALAEITKLHEQYFGILTSNLAEKFKDFVENYRGPVEWIKLAFDEAVKYKSRRWQYVEKILYSWQEKGGPHADRERGDKGEQLGAHREDAGEGDKFSGFRAIESGPDREED